MNREFFVTVPNDFYNNIHITNEELVVYTLLKRNYIQIKEVGITSINMIMQYMNVENRNNRMVNKIKEAIKGLIEKKYIVDILDLQYNHIDFNKVGNNDLFYIEIEPLLDKYFCVYDYDLDVIFEYLHKSNIDKFSFVRYFIAVNRVISNQAEFGFLTQSSIKNICGENKTVSRYNKILQDELNLILYNNDYMTSERHYTSTYFGKYDNKENFEFQLKNEVSSRCLVLTNKIKSNKRRSNTQKINKVSKKINDINKDDEIEELKAKLAKLEEEKKELEYKNNIELSSNNHETNTKEDTDIWGEDEPNFDEEDIKIDNKVNRIKEIADYILNSYDNSSKEKREEYKQKFGIIKWYELNEQEIEFKFNEVKDFFITKEDDPMLQYINSPKIEKPKIPFDGFFNNYDMDNPF